MRRPSRDSCWRVGAWCFAMRRAREPLAPAWRDLLVALRRMESRGEIRGGRFLPAFIGEQFALPEALDLLRTIRRTGETAAAPDLAQSLVPSASALLPASAVLSH